MNSAKMSVILPKYPSGTPKTLCSASPMLQNPFVSPQNPHPYTTKKRQFSARFCGYSVKITHKLPFFGAQHRFVLRFLTFRPERKRTVNRRSSLRSSPASSLLFRGLSFVSARMPQALQYCLVPFHQIFAHQHSLLPHPLWYSAIGCSSASSCSIRSSSSPSPLRSSG